MEWGIGLGLLAAAIGACVSALAAGIGISRIAVASNESIARQPEVAGQVKGNMILTAALIEGVALFACVICIIIAVSVTGLVGKIAQDPVKNFPTSHPAK